MGYGFLFIVAMLEQNDSQPAIQHEKEHRNLFRFLPSGGTHDSAYAFFASDLRTVSLRFFFSNMTVNRSKSVSFFRRSTNARFFAHEVLPHFSSTPAFSTYFLTVAVPAARGRSGTTKEVSVRCR